MDLDDLRRRVATMEWYHSMDLGHGIVTRGLSQTPALGGDALPDFTGRSVLDIGAWDGYYSFEAERLGARSVMALDHYAWCLDFAARERYWSKCRDEGVLPDAALDTTEFWHPDAPRRAGFDLAREALGSRVRTLTAEVAVVETAAVEVKGYETARLLSVQPGDDLDADFGNWYLPSEAALHGLCRAAGFRRVVTVRRHGFPERPRRPWQRWSLRATRPYRLAVHAFC